MPKRSYSYSGKYFSDHDQLRSFLRFISFGCFHKDDYKRLTGFSGSYYNLCLKLAMSCLPEGTLQSFQQHHQKHHLLRGDTYYTCNNYLANSYVMKRLTPRRLFYLAGFLQLVAAGPELTDWKQPASLTALSLETEEGEIISWEHTDIVLQQVLSFLTRQGYVIASGTKRRRIYKLAANPLTGLSLSEAEELFFALGFYRCIAPLGMPGYILADKLKELFPSLDSCFIPCQFRNAAFTRILDDEVAAQLLLAAERGETVSFLYNSPKVLRYGSRQAAKQEEVVPRRLITDFVGGGRQYLVTGKKEGGAQAILHLEQISGVKNEEKKAQPESVSEARQMAVSEPRRVPLRLFFHLLPGQSESALKGRITELWPAAEFAPGGQGFFCTLYAADLLQLIPLVRRFFPFAEVLPDEGHNLRERVREDLKEALKNYGVL